MGFFGELHALAQRYERRAQLARRIPGVIAVRLLDSGLIRASVRPGWGARHVVHVRARGLWALYAAAAKARRKP